MRGHTTTQGFWPDLTQFMQTQAGHLVSAGVVILLAVIARFIFILIAEGYITKVASRTNTDLDDKLVRKVKEPVGNVIFLIGMYFAVYFLNLPRAPYDWRNLADNIIDTLIILMSIWLVLRMVDLWAYAFQSGWKQKSIVKFDQVLPFLRDLAKILTFVGGMVALLMAWGKDPTVLLAGLGIGGLAIGFAAQDTIANIFGSITIFADKPFEAGDSILVKDIEGTVEEVGFRTTKVRMADHTLVTIPNSMIATSPVKNFSRRPHLKVEMRLGIVYETPIERIKSALQGIRSMLEKHEHVSTTPIVVNFETFSDSALIILISFFTDTSDWQSSLNIREDINLKIMKLFEEMNVEFAYPTSTVWHKGDMGDGGMPMLSDGDLSGDM